MEELKRNVEELEQVKLSLKNELRELEAVKSKRQCLLKEVQEHSVEVDVIQNMATALRADVQQRLRELDELRVAKKEINKPKELPLKLTNDLDVETYPSVTFKRKKDCTLSSCFNFQQCSFFKDFQAHVYNPDKLIVNSLRQNDVTERIYYLFKSMPYTDDILTRPCIYIVIIDSYFGNKSYGNRKIDLENAISKLPHWKGDGHNHLLINFAGEEVLGGVNIGRAILVQPSFGYLTPYRRNFDIAIPHWESLLNVSSVWAYSEPQLPAKRKYLLSFQGGYHVDLKDSQRRASFLHNDDLKRLSLEANDIYIKLSCKGDMDKAFVSRSGWKLCGTATSRAAILKNSTYALILQSKRMDDQIMSLVRFVEALRYGAIPVVLANNIILPFEDMIDWRQAVVMLHNAQLPQVHFILRTISVSELLDMRRQGRFLWETYLSTTEAVLSTTLAVMRTRLSLPPRPFKDVDYPSVFNKDNQPVFNPPVSFDDITEHPVKSPTFYRNFTLNNVYASRTWNMYPGALEAFPTDPFVPVLPSSAGFFNSLPGFQPLGKGAGAAGAEFKKALGGNYPVEQFTIVMLTFERELVLVKALGKLAGLQHLNKVIVIWNSPQAPSPDLKWPIIGVPIHVLKPEKNSLNNRFLPHKQIETDAILSMDDDVHLKHDEISFGFRVWREARDRIVGFPGRFHAWDLNFGGWLYNANYSCELSMILTGAAFFHKYYTYLYSRVMPKAIRNKVDEYTNCEDIAMNFLVSHVTRKPPIKVTSRWTFRCPGCSQTLSQDETHFNERHKCINFFVKVYGYMPLLRTQFRADSVLFKTRLPHDKSKCFAHI